METVLSYLISPGIFALEVGYAFVIYFIVQELKGPSNAFDIVFCLLLAYVLPVVAYFIKSAELVYLPSQSIAYAIVYYCSVRWKSMRGEKAW